MRLDTGTAVGENPMSLSPRSSQSMSKAAGWTFEPVVPIAEPMGEFMRKFNSYFLSMTCLGSGRIDIGDVDALGMCRFS